MTLLSIGSIPLLALESAEICKVHGCDDEFSCSGVFECGRHYIAV